MPWSCRSGETIIDHIDCSRLTMDNERNVYVTDFGKDEGKRYQMSTVYVTEGPGLYERSNNHRMTRSIKGITKAEVIASENGQRVEPNQLNRPDDLSFDRNSNQLCRRHRESSTVQRFDTEKN